jgi:cytohesin
LHLAADQGHKKIVELLIAKSANVNAKDDKGRTPLDWAEEEENKEITGLLHKHGGKTGKELKESAVVKESIHAAARYGNLEAVKQHLAAGTDVSFRNKNGDTPLNYAAYLGHMEIVELLVENGANVNAKGLADWTPLHLAAHKNKEKIVQLLIANGAEVNPYTSPDFGGTPLDVANGKIANLLRKHGGKTAVELKAEGK